MHWKSIFTAEFDITNSEIPKNLFNEISTGAHLIAALKVDVSEGFDLDKIEEWIVIRAQDPKFEIGKARFLGDFSLINETTFFVKDLGKDFNAIWYHSS